MQFQPGNKLGNGRPSLPEELKTKLRAECPGVLDFWIATYANENENFGNRNKAAENIWNYAYGKPKELIDIDMQGRLENIEIRIIDPKE